MTFKRTDAGRSQSKRPKQTRDCTVRALARTLVIPYDDAYTILAKAGRKCNRGFDIEAWCRKTTCQDGLGATVYWRLQKMPYTQADTGGSKRYRISNFLNDNPHGTFMVASAKHVFAVVNGVVHDDELWHFVEDRPVYAWMELRVARLPLWQCSAMRRPIRVRPSGRGKGGKRMVRRAVGLVEGASYKLAMKVASQWYEWALRKGEDMAVAAVAAIDSVATNSVATK